MWPRVSLDVSAGKLPALVLMAAGAVVLAWVLGGLVLALFAGAVIATLVAASAAGLDSGAPRGPGAAAR